MPMTSPYPPSYGAQPAQFPSPTAPAKLRGKGLIIVGSLLMLAATVVFVVGIVAAVGSVNNASGFARVDAGTSRTIHLDEGGWTLYFEYLGSNDYTDAALGLGGAPTITVIAPDGHIVPLQLYLTTASYTANGRHGVAVQTFHADRSGDYTIKVGDSVVPGARVAVGHSIVRGLGNAIGLIVLSGIVGFTGLVLLIVGLVTRSSSRRQNPALGYATYGVPTAPTGYGPGALTPPAFGPGPLAPPAPPPPAEYQGPMAPPPPPPPPPQTQ